MLEVVVKYSPKSFCQLKIWNSDRPELSSEDLDSVFMSWGSRLQKQLTLIIYRYFGYSLHLNKEITTTIENIKN